MAFVLDDNRVEVIEGMTVEYPYCLHRRNFSDIMIPWHWHEELELGYMEKGEMIISTLNGEYHIKEGDGFFVNSDVMTSKRNAEEGTAALEVNHIFHPVFLTGHFKSLFERKYLNPVLKNRQIEVVVFHQESAADRLILEGLKRLAILQDQDNIEFQTRNLLSEIWLLLLESVNKEQKTNNQPMEAENRLQQMLLYIHRHFSDKMSLAEIAAAANISEREALRSFQKTLHQSPIDYLISYRLNTAKTLLIETDLAMTDIAYRCGFSGASYFSKSFKQAVGMTPKGYRQSRQESSM